MAQKLIIETILKPIATKKAFGKIENQAKKSGTNIGGLLEKGISKGLKKGAALAAALLVVAKAFRVMSEQAKLATSELKEFSRGVAEVNSILPQNQKLTQNSIETFREFAGTFATGTAKQADAFYKIVSAGVKGTTDQLKTLKVANTAAVAGLVDIDEASKLLVSSVNAYAASGLTAADASDALFVAVREGQTTFQELSNFLGNATSIAASSGVTFQELAASVAFVTKAGLQTDRAVIGLRQVFTSVIKPTKEAADEAKSLGLEFSTAAIRAKGFAGFLKDVAEKTGGNEKSLARLFGNVRALAPILNIVNGNFAEFVRIQNEVKDSLGATDTAAKEIQKSFDFKVDKAKAQLALLRQEIVEKLIPAMTWVIEKFVEFTNWLEVGWTRTKKLEKRVAEITMRLKELAPTAEAAASGFNRNAVEAEKAKREMVLLNKELKKINDELKVLKTEELINQNTFVQLTRARIQLQELENEMKNISTAFASGRLSVVIASEIKRVQDKIKALELSLNPIPKKMKKIIPQETIDKILALAAALAQINKAAAETETKFKKHLGSGVEQTVVNMVSRVGAALKIGAKAWENWEAAILNILGDMAINLGVTILGIGKAIEALSISLKSLTGGFAIAAGVALIALGGVLKATAGTLTDSATGGIGGFGGGGNTNQILPEPEDVERLTSSEINITVEGSLVQQDELGQFLSDVISESNEKSGNVILNQRFA